jgi:hypothetical protein
MDISTMTEKIAVTHTITHDDTPAHYKTGESFTLELETGYKIIIKNPELVTHVWPRSMCTEENGWHDDDFDGWGVECMNEWHEWFPADA